MAVLGSGNAAFGQGKGNKGGGGGKPENHGNGNGGRDQGGDNGRGNGGKHGGFERQQQQPPQRVQVYQDPNAGRQQARPEWKQERRAERQNDRGQEQRRIEVPQYQPRPQITVPQYEDRRSQSGNRRPWEGLPPGQYRKQENLERRDERKADKEYAKELKRQYKEDRKDDRRDYQRRVQYIQSAPAFLQYYTYDRSRQYDRDRYVYNDDNNYNGQYDDRYDINRYNSGVSWKQRLLSTVLSQFLGGGQNNLFGQNDGYGYNDPNYNNTQYGGNYGQQQYYPAYNGGYYDNGYGSYDPGSFINALPYENFIDQYSDDFAADSIRQALGMGYDDGYTAGRYARVNGTSGDNYYDPYSYPNGGYNGTSISLAERRQILSEGYELGYQDALYGRNGNNYDPRSQGNTDLISLLLNNVLRVI